MEGLREQIAQISRELWERGLVGCIEGNVSCRTPAGTVLITPAGQHKGHLNPEDIAEVRLNGEVISGTPSSESQMHLTMYEVREDCMAVVHAHPPFATAHAVAHQAINAESSPEALAILGVVPLVPFGMPGTPALSNQLRPMLRGAKAFLLANHGAVVMGSGLFDAYARMEILERVCRVSSLICQAEWREHRLPEEAIDWLDKRYPPEKL